MPSVSAVGEYVESLEKRKPPAGEGRGLSGVPGEGNVASKDLTQVS